MAPGPRANRGDVGIAGGRVTEIGRIRAVAPRTLEHGAATGNLPGELLRGPGARPAA